jgi:hypothetical protein
MSDTINTAAESKRLAANALMDAHSEGVKKLDASKSAIDIKTYADAESALEKIWELANDWYGEANDADGEADDVLEAAFDSIIKKQRTADGLAAIPSMKFEAPFKLKGDGGAAVHSYQDYEAADRIDYLVSFKKVGADVNNAAAREMLVEISIRFAPNSSRILNVTAQVTDGDSVWDNRIIRLAEPEAVVA